MENISPMRLVNGALLALAFILIAFAVYPYQSNHFEVGEEKVTGYITEMDTVSIANSSDERTELVFKNDDGELLDLCLHAGFDDIEQLTSYYENVEGFEVTYQTYLIYPDAACKDQIVEINVAY